MQEVEVKESRREVVKCCTKCREEKSTSEFYKEKRGKFGVEAICKLCTALKYQKNRDRQCELARTRYKENREEILSKNKVYREQNKETLSLKDSIRKKKYREENKEECLAKDQTYRNKNAATIKKRQAKWAKDNSDRLKENRKRYYLENREDILKKTAKWTLSNRPKSREYKRKWNDLNPHRRRAGRYRRRSLLKTATPSWTRDEFEDFVMQEMYLLSRLRTQITGIKWHVDHKVPLVSEIVCGLHCAANLQVIPAETNLSKSNVYWEDMP